MEHCCKELNFFLEEDKVSINYYPKYREYSINLKSSNGYQVIIFCPWCGTKFPEPLDDEWFDILENQMQIDTDIKENIPKEFLTDEWWKNLKNSS